MSLYNKNDGLDDFEEKEEYIPEYVYKRGNDAVANYLFHRNNANPVEELEEIEKNLYEVYLDDNDINNDKL